MSQAILDAFKAAAEIEGQDANGKPLYIDAVLTFINNNASALLTGANGGNFDDMPAGAGRQQAIAMGLHEIKSFFGDFDDIADLIAALDHQILVEHTKFLILENIKTAQSADELETALQIIEAMNDQRQELIEEWSTSGNAAAEARAAALEDEAYTIVLKEIASKLGTPTYLAALAEKIWAARANGPFYGVGTLVAALDAADQEIDDEALVSAFNAVDGTDPDAWQDALALIKNNTATLLDAEALAKLTTLPDGGGREKAIGLGVLEIKTLFGDFASIEDVQTAVAMQIEVEYAKYEFITALDAATTAAEMTDAILDTIELVHQHRQDLIEAWSNSGDPDAVARAAELANTDFTTVLAEIVSRLNDTAYMAELGVRMLALRSAQQGGKFFGDGRIITALAAADTAIEAEHDATITGDFTGALSEDGNGEVVADTLSVQDEDWGENVFQAVDAADLQKTYGTFAFDHETGAWTFTLNNDAAQSLKEGEEVEQTLTVTSFDGTAEKTITVTVTGTNDDPTAAATGNSVSGTVNTTITGNVPAGSDVDGDALTYELVGTLEGLTFNANGSFSYEPADDFTGNVTFQYKVKDPNGARARLRPSRSP